jgi:hypothetical protein
MHSDACSCGTTKYRSSLIETIGLTVVIWWREHCFKQNPAVRLPRIYIPRNRVNMPPGYSLRATLFGYGPDPLSSSTTATWPSSSGCNREHRGSFVR